MIPEPENIFLYRNEFYSCWINLSESSSLMVKSSQDVSNVLESDQAVISNRTGGKKVTLSIFL